MAEEIKKRWEPAITPAALPYLQVQQGRIAELEGDAWLKAYADGLHENLAQIRHFIPAEINGVLDIGGGMGGIDALLNHEFGGAIDVVIVDGDRDKPIAPKVDDGKTYSNCAAAFEFLTANGVVHPKFLLAPAEPAKTFDKGFLSTIEPVDLVIGVQSWGFHFAPAVHMPLAFAFSHPGTVWILDVREYAGGRSPWLVQLVSEERLEPIGRVPGYNEKFARHAFRVIE